MTNQSSEEVAVNHRVVRVFSVQELYERYPDREFLMPLNLAKETMSSRQSRHEQNKERAKAYQNPIPEKKTSAKKKKIDPESANEEDLKKRHLYDQAYREANRENIREKARVRRDLHKEKEKAQCRDYYQKNKEEITTRHKAYYLANKEKHALYNKAYRELNKEKIMAQRKARKEAQKQS